MESDRSEGELAGILCHYAKKAESNKQVEQTDDSIANSTIPTWKLKIAQSTISNVNEILSYINAIQ